jgi:hypothetical protein
MPIPKPNKDESKKDFLSRCMENPTMNKEYPDSNQRYAVCNSQTRGSLLEEALKILSMKYNCGCSEDTECECEYEDEDNELTLSNLIIPKSEDYIDFGEVTEEYDISVLAKYKYSDPVTNEIFYFDRMNTYKKNGRPLVYMGKAAEYQGRKVTLNKPFRTSNGPKKFAVYTKNDKGKVVIVRFGDPNMKIKKNIPERRKNFRARHNCDNPGPKWKARYWSCKAW